MNRKKFVGKVINEINKRVEKGDYGNLIMAGDVDGRHLTAIVDIIWSQNEVIDEMNQRIEILENDERDFSDIGKSILSLESRIYKLEPDT